MDNEKNVSKFKKRKSKELKSIKTLKNNGELITKYGNALKNVETKT